MADQEYQNMIHLEILSTESFGVGGRKDRTDTYILRGTDEQIADKIREWALSAMKYNSRTKAFTVRPVPPMDVIELGEKR